MLWSKLFSAMEACRNACVKPGLFESCLVRVPPRARVVRSGASCSSPRHVQSGCAPGSAPSPPPPRPSRAEWYVLRGPHPRPRAEWLCPGSPPPDHVCAGPRAAQLGRRFVPAAGFRAGGLELGAVWVGPLFAPRPARLPAGLRAPWLLVGESGRPRWRWSRRRPNRRDQRRQGRRPS